MRERERKKECVCRRAEMKEVMAGKYFYERVKASQKMKKRLLRWGKKRKNRREAKKEKKGIRREEWGRDKIRKGKKARRRWGNRKKEEDVENKKGNRGERQAN